MFEKPSQQTIKRLIANDEEAFNEIYNKYRQLLYLIILNITGDLETSKDLLQDTFIKIYQQASNLRKMGKFHSWAISIAKNTALNYQKKMKEMQLTDQQASLIVDEENNRQLFDTWHSFLDDRLNLIIAYRIVYELTFNEISSLMDEPITTIYKSYRLALGKLRDHYRKER
jgi:RNA polymerase sigma factor (sigma-70 family)